ncbi:hypothetical protein K8352_12580 [Flavobacteriaceae bacterium F89]|uniref:Uncharacterized protein n=1 Tax=Cerina litoralis TaxID=2874477 RepID=A0AAE3EVA3_9FLAO|nr:hypothetical protein [Cerina litoralis]MCG2461588.1 hypothetical protein [Cerina litoralis]
MKKCIIMFALLVATLLIAAWSNKGRSVGADHTLTSKVDASANPMLVQHNTLNKRKGQ